MPSDFFADPVQPAGRDSARLGALPAAPFDVGSDAVPLPLRFRRATADQQFQATEPLALAQAGMPASVLSQPPNVQLNRYEPATKPVEIPVQAKEPSALAQTAVRAPAKSQEPTAEMNRHEASVSEPEGDYAARQLPVVLAYEPPVPQRPTLAAVELPVAVSPSPPPKLTAQQQNPQRMSENDDFEDAEALDVATAFVECEADADNTACKDLKKKAATNVKAAEKERRRPSTVTQQQESPIVVQPPLAFTQQHKSPTNNIETGLRLERDAAMQPFEELPWISKMALHDREYSAAPALESPSAFVSRTLRSATQVPHVVDPQTSGAQLEQLSARAASDAKHVERWRQKLAHNLEGLEQVSKEIEDYRQHANVELPAEQHWRHSIQVPSREGSKDNKASAGPIDASLGWRRSFQAPLQRQAASLGSQLLSIESSKAPSQDHNGVGSHLSVEEFQRRLLEDEKSMVASANAE